ncbi:MAG TPA: class I SAM-dependent methyltransferase [Flavobacterium sp.]|nr:class I SAM-dependent methyltransferase [Flavobacterium sp.]
MLFQIKKYLKFLWKSTNQHGVHSPFVFDLVTKCFYDKKIHPEYSILKKYRRSLLQNHHFIEVTDFGAGSKIFKSNKRKISKIAETAGITVRNSELLFRIVNYFKPSTILEIGTSLGLATAAISLGSRSVGTDSIITTLEGCPETAGIAKQQFEKFGFGKIDLKITPFEEILPDFRLSTFDLIYFDGNHQKEATLSYFELLLPTITNDSVWIFDDIHWSVEMEQAWEKIKENPKVTVTIDTFQWGIVFFRKEQEKEHFTIRA